MENEKKNEMKNDYEMKPPNNIQRKNELDSK